ncbi:MAG: tetratricopeptide repeat protein [Bacteroidetes bacterium]|nr:tetratricopeptide repeat protein [Bacteroidota bacterium]
MQIQLDLGKQFYSEGAYDKSSEIFEELYKKYKTEENYEYLLNSYVGSKNYKSAEKLVEKKIKEFPQSTLFQIDLGFVFSAAGDEKKTIKSFEKALQLLPADNQEIIFTAARFIKRKQNDWAIQTYLKGRKLVHNDYPFSFELAEVYKSQGNISEMMNEYLFVLEYGEGYLAEVQNALINAIGDDASGKKKKVLKDNLLKKIQENPNNDLYLEMLVWELIQEKEFSTALIQTKALDKRKREEGERLIRLSEFCLKNEDYETAAKALKYVIEKGESSMYYRRAKMDYVKVLNQKITTRPDYTPQDLNELENAYVSGLKELGKNTFTLEMMQDYSHLLAFYLHNTNKAIELLQEAIAMPRASTQQIAECKLELGDIYLISNKIWDASLLYSQVELDFKFDVLGQDAKYRNAKISYYTGDFKWAKAQLDILKAATDRLIANDAMYLSLLITGNTIMDTITTPLEMFARADLLEFQNKDSLCLLTLDSLESEFKSRYNLMDDVMYLRAQIYLKKHQWTEAADALQKTYEHKDLLADDALFQLANLYENILNDKAKAQEKYEEILFKFPGSIYVEEARKRFRRLRGDKEF